MAVIRDRSIVVYVRWLDGYLEKFIALEVRFGSNLLWIRNSEEENRHIPLQNVRWYSIYPESHEKTMVNKLRDEEAAVR